MKKFYVILVFISINVSFGFIDVINYSDTNDDTFVKIILDKIKIAKKENQGKIISIEKFFDNLYFQQRVKLKKINRLQTKIDLSREKKILKLNKLIDNISVEMYSIHQKMVIINRKVENIDKKINNKNLHKSEQTSQLKKLHLKRNKDQEIYIETIEQHKKLLASVTKVKNILDNLIQIKQIKSHDLNNALQESKNVLLEVFSQEELENLISLDSIQDNAQIGNLAQILGKLQKSVEKSLNDDEENENQSKKLYEEIKRQYDNEINNITKKIKKKQDLVKIHKKEFSNLVNQMNKKSEVLGKYQSKVKARNELYHSEDSKLKEKVDKIKRMMETITKLKIKYIEKIKGLEESVKDKVRNMLMS